MLELEDEDGNKPYQLLCTYLKNKYFISTAYRRASTYDAMWYFETIVWEWDDKTKVRGKMLETKDSGPFESYAIKSHMDIVQKLNNPIESEEV